MEKKKKRRVGALALSTALVLGGCLNSRPLYAVGLGEPAGITARVSGEQEQQTLPVAGEARLLETGEDVMAGWKPGPIYDRLQTLPGGLWLAERQGRFGVVDGQGNILAPLVYQDEFSARRAAHGIQADMERQGQ